MVSLLGFQSTKIISHTCVFGLTLTLPGSSAGVSGSLDSYCSLKPLCSGMGEVVPARTSPKVIHWYNKLDICGITWGAFIARSWFHGKVYFTIYTFRQVQTCKAGCNTIFE